MLDLIERPEGRSWPNKNRFTPGPGMLANRPFLSRPQDHPDKARSFGKRVIAQKVQDHVEVSRVLAVRACLMLVDQVLADEGQNLSEPDAPLRRCRYRSLLGSILW